MIENGCNGLNGWERTLTRLWLVLIRRRRKKIRFRPFRPLHPFSIMSLWLNKEEWNGFYHTMKNIFDAIETPRDLLAQRV